MKYLGIKLIKYVEDLQEENCKTLMYKNQRTKEIDIPCSWIRRLNIVKISILSRLIYKFNATPVKIPASYFVAINKLIATN